MFLFITKLPRPLFCVPYSTVLTDKNGSLAAAAIASDEQWRFPLHDSIPDKFIKAIVCFEDKRFFNHPGIDPFAITRAFKKNFSSGTIKSGASTLSMQVIRLARCKKKRTVIEKCIEMYYAIQLEIFYSKKEILHLYAAHAPFGGNVVGLETASWRYFGRSPNALSWAETCMLAVLPNAPSLIHLGKNRSLLLKKRNNLLKKLLDNSIISKETWQLSTSEPLPPSPHPIPQHIPHLLARYQSPKATMPQHKKTHDILYKNNFAQTTIDLNIQKQAEAICSRHHHHLAGNNINNIAALILDIKKNTVLAYIGNVKDSLVNNSYFVDCIAAPRSTGSALKPFLYCAMNYTGQLIPSQIIFDIPTRIAGFAPRNYTRTFEGAVPASAALAKSLNVPAVRMLYDYGVDRFYGDLKKTGLTTLTRKASEYGLSLILGGAEGTLWDLTSAFAGMARTVNAYFDSTIDKGDYLYEHPAYLQDYDSDHSSNGEICQDNP
ncbi:MAG: transglycosylase domain-containing protein, partial [Fibrobacter sp.]|nr:transglycosylase domain-containing protein [Fibrobacter sp.]